MNWDTEFTGFQLIHKKPLGAILLCRAIRDKTDVDFGLLESPHFTSLHTTGTMSLSFGSKVGRKTGTLECYWTGNWSRGGLADMPCIKYYSYDMWEPKFHF